MSETLQLEQLTGFLQQLLGESLFAIYLYGSAVDGGLGPESDLDLLVVITQALTFQQRQQLTETLLKISYPIGAAQRALEVTIVRKDQILSGLIPPVTIPRTVVRSRADNCLKEFDLCVQW